MLTQYQTPVLSQWQAKSRNKVLRNTFALLALSMVPTTMGALFGLAVGPIHAPFWIQLIAFMAISFGFMWAIEKNNTTGTGVALLLAFTFFMGFMLSGILRNALSLSNGPTLIALAALGTGSGFAGMSMLALKSQGKDFSKINQMLTVGLFVVIGASIANIFLHVPAFAMAISTIMAIISAMFILVEVKKIIDGGQENYVSATLQVYLNTYNLFSSLLSLLTSFGRG